MTLNPWDVQSRQIFTTDGVFYALYAGEGGQGLCDI